MFATISSQNHVRLVFTAIRFVGGWCFIHYICAYLCISLSNSNNTSVISRAGPAYPSRIPRFTDGFLCGQCSVYWSSSSSYRKKEKFEEVKRWSDDVYQIRTNTIMAQKQPIKYYTEN